MRIIVTGGTGFVGSHFLRHIALHHPDIAPRVIVRGKDDADAQRRLSEALAVTHAAYRSQGTIADHTALRGDITEPNAGLGDQVLAATRAWQADQFWHFASSLSFDANQKQSVHAHNIAGLQTVLELSVALGCRHFVYVSTAYSSGLLTGSIPEALHAPSIGFNNYYEESKCLAEHAAAAFCRAHRIALTILRPSIVIGPMTTKLSGGSTTGLYALIRAVRRAQPVLRAAQGPVRYLGRSETPLNTIPIDWLLEDISTLIGRGLEDGDIHHLSIEEAATIGDVMDAVRTQLGAGLTIAEFDPADGSPLEQSIAASSLFRPYAIQTKYFERGTLERRWKITAGDINDFVSTYLGELS